MPSAIKSKNGKGMNNEPQNAEASRKIAGRAHIRFFFCSLLGVALHLIHWFLEERCNLVAPWQVLKGRNTNHRIIPG